MARRAAGFSSRAPLGARREMVHLRARQARSHSTLGTVCHRQTFPLHSQSENVFMMIIIIIIIIIFIFIIIYCCFVFDFFGWDMSQLE